MVSAMFGLPPIFPAEEAFADELAIMLSTAGLRCLAQMQDMLKRLEEFCDWAGIAISISKTEITGFDFGCENRQRPLPLLRRPP